MNNDQNINQKVIVISGAANFLGVSIDTLRRWDKSGKVHPVRINGRRHFPVEDLKRIKDSKPLLSSSQIQEENPQSVIFPKKAYQVGLFLLAFTTIGLTIMTIARFLMSFP